MMYTTVRCDSLHMLFANDAVHIAIGEITKHANEKLELWERT